MNSDAKLQIRIIDALREALGPTRIGVTVRQNVVTLSGYANTIIQKQEAEAVVRAVPGVVGLVEEVMIDCRPGGCEVEAIQQLMGLAEPGIGPGDTLDITLENSTLLLSGSLDGPEQARFIAEIAAKLLPEAVIENALEIRHPVSQSEVHDRVIAALTRTDRIEGDPVHIVVHGDTVSLGGRVPYSHLRQAAERAALAASGVANVENNILVG